MKYQIEAVRLGYIGNTYFCRARKTLEIEFKQRNPENGIKTKQTVGENAPAFTPGNGKLEI